MAHVKQKGGYKGSSDSESKRLGVKRFDGQTVNPGTILIRQNGTKFHPGKNVKKGKDDTLFSIAEGKVKFSKQKRQSFTGAKKYVKVVNVI
ncbi:MAG: 50S ribosomal protein L27 [Candidatus Paceibacterota bacterium]